MITVRDRETIDNELRLLAAVREFVAIWAAGVPSIGPVDERHAIPTMTNSHFLWW
jgi:hypothetical protein